MMKKKVHLLFSAAPPSSLSPIGTISDIRSFSYIVPSSLSNNQSPPPLSSVSFLYVLTIRAISEIRSLSNTLPSFGGVGGGPLRPSPAPSPSLSTIRDIREIRSLTSTTPSPLSKNKPRPTIRVHLTHMYLTFVTFEKFVVSQV